MKTPINNNNLKQLFNKAKADEQNLDDFEKEAMAGFNMLESENEAFDTNNKMTDRINTELFNKTENSNHKVYWMAAAGLALVIGLSTFFILTDTNSISKNNLAITDTKTENSPTFQEELKETISPDEKAPAKDALEKQNFGNTSLSDNENASGGKEKNPNLDQVRVANQEQSAATDLDREESTVKAVNTKSGEGINARSTKNDYSDNLAKSSSAKDKENDANKIQTPASAPVQTIKLEESEKKVADEVASGEVNQLGKSDNSNDDRDAKKQTTTYKNISATNSVSRKENRVKEKAKKTNSSQNAPSMAGPEEAENKPSAPSSVTKGAASEETKSKETEDVKQEKDFINCFYPGGESGITKDIKEKLIPENLNQKFDVILYINEKKVVDKVEFINSYDLTKNQKEEVTKILKSLNKFDFFMVPTKKSNYPYKVLYRP